MTPVPTYMLFSRGLRCPSCGSDAGDVSKFCPSCGSTLVRAADGDDSIGKIVIGKYRVEALIGEGGMGKVYRARQLALDKPVVLKVLRQSLLSDERTVARFQREAKAASRLNHPNSISILDFGQSEEGSLFIAMEYVSGKDLHQILSKEWPLPESRIVRIVSQVLSALSDAHGAGVIHRDLKPENIMVEQRRGDADFVKVLDFGIAKIQDSAGDEGPALTRAGFVCGTPEYMSPEQARGAQLDARSDLYAVGVILYQLTAGLLPFESDSAVGFATKHLTEIPPPPSKRRPDARISPAMERLILRALSKDPNDRPQAAEQFRSELFAVDRERRHGTPSQRSSGPPPLQPFPRKVTPSEPQSETQLQSGPPWLQVESTVAAYDNVQANPVDLKTAPVPPYAEATLRAAPKLLIFKIITLSLVVISVGLAGYYLYTTNAPSLFGSQPGYVMRGGAPVPIEPSTQVDPPEDSAPYDREVPSNERDVEGAARLAREGDAAHQSGDLETAAAKYLAAFEKNPDPQLSLKLGEVQFQRNLTQDAKGWWARHLKDQADSKARGYIHQVFQDP
jgi:serine/threonine protein kinase